MITAAFAELEQVGASQRPQLALADAQYWNEQHIDQVVGDQHMQVLIPPDSEMRHGPRGHEAPQQLRDSVPGGWRRHL